MLGPPGGRTAAPATPHRQLWPIAPTPAPTTPRVVGGHQVTSQPNHVTNTVDGMARYGLYSLFPSTSAPGAFQPRLAHSGGAYHPAHKVATDSLFAAGGYTFGSATPPPGSPYSPMPVTQLELLAKNLNTSTTTISQSTNSIIVQQQQTDFMTSAGGVNLSKQEDKRREAALAAERRWERDLTPLTIKTEMCKKSCSDCNSPDMKHLDGNSGCSRTIPVTWTSPGTLIQIKREPSATPCQVAEVTTSHMATPNMATMVKMEVPSPKSEIPSVSGAGSIPVGIAVARQRLQQEVSPMTSMASIGASGGLLTSAPLTMQNKDITRITEMGREHAAMMPLSGDAMTVGGPLGSTLLQCGDDRTPIWPMANTQNQLGAPTLWQYPGSTLPYTLTAPMSMEPMIPFPMPPPVGFQLVRDPGSGHWLLIPTTSMTGIDPFPQTVVWPSYPQTMQPPLILPPPPLTPLPPLHLLSSDYLTTATTLHQHTQTHSTRLVALTSDPKRKQNMQLPGHTVIKIEADASMMDQCQGVSCSKALSVSSMTSSSQIPFTDTMAPIKTLLAPITSTTQMPYSDAIAPIVTTHLIYQHPNSLIQISTSDQETICRSQATSPVGGMTPPLDMGNGSMLGSSMESLPEVQDASNQTDTPIVSEDENTCTTQIQDVSNDFSNDNAMEDVKNFEPETQYTTTAENLTFTTFTSQSEGAFCSFTKTENISTISIKQTDALIPQDNDSTIPKIVEITEDQNNTVDDIENQEEMDLTPPISETKTGSKPDLSGLELLSNSIEQFESAHKTFETVPTSPAKPEIIQQEITAPVIQPLVTQENQTEDLKAPVDDSTLGGLGLLCELAAQRIEEEACSPKKHKLEDQHNMPLKKRIKHEIEDTVIQVPTSTATIIKDTAPDVLIDKPQPEGNTDQEITVQNSLTNCYCNSPNGNCICIRDQVRCYRELANLKLIYSKALKELDRYKSEKNEEKPPRTPSPPLLDKIDDLPLRNESNLCDLRTPPKLKAALILYPPGVVKTSPLEENDVFNTEALKRAISPTIETNSDSTIERVSSSKKRKVGRPKKHGKVVATETIFAKKPKSKGCIVGYLLSSKANNNKGGIIYSKVDPTRPNDDSRFDQVKITTPVKTITTPDANYNPQFNSTSRVRPKLKAEAKFRNTCTDDDVTTDWPSSDVSEVKQKTERRHHKSSKRHSDKHKRKKLKKLDYRRSQSSDSEAETRNNKSPKIENSDIKKLNVMKQINSLCILSDRNACSDSEPIPKQNERKRKRKKKNESKTSCSPQKKPRHEVKIVIKDKDVKKEDEQEECIAEHGSKVQLIQEQHRCVLTEEHFAQDATRVLTATGGLFYAGLLRAVRPPDIYAVTFDKARGNRPHIMTREEVLRDSIVEVCPVSVAEVPPGTRLCAYWSGQYRCLYPGTAVEPGTPDPKHPKDEKFVSVEFDDDDSGTIAIEDIRLLPSDYPIIEYDPNPLLTLGKRKRRTSANSSERQTVPLTSNENIIQKQEPVIKIATQPSTDCVDTHRERKRMKKHKRDKVKRCRSGSGTEDASNRKHKRKHRICDEHCKQRRHHKRHRKHKKHHRSSKEDSESNREDRTNKKDKYDSNENDKDESIETNYYSNEENNYKKNETPLKKDTILKKSVFAGRLTSFDNEKLNDKQDNVTSDEVEDSADDEDVDEIEELDSNTKAKKGRERQESVESSKSKIAPFLPQQKLWDWQGKGYKRPGVKGRKKKWFYKTIKRDKETISVGDSAVFLSIGRADRPYIGHIESMWQSNGNNIVRVKWFYHPEETKGCPTNFKYPGALFESPHADENDVQTISHKCEVLPLHQYRKKIGDKIEDYSAIYENNDTYYLAGRYEPGAQKLTIAAGIEFTEADPQ